jgi:hypothetical protein
MVMWEATLVPRRPPETNELGMNRDMVPSASLEGAPSQACPICAPSQHCCQRRTGCGAVNPGKKHRGFCTVVSAPWKLHRGNCTVVSAPWKLHRETAPWIIAWLHGTDVEVAL